MTKRTQPMNLTKPLWKWRRNYGRLRIAWISRHDWWLCGAWSWSWWFVFRNYPVRDLEYSGIPVGGYWQVTILGLQIGYCYRNEFNPNDK